MSRWRILCTLMLMLVLMLVATSVAMPAGAQEDDSDDCPVLVEEALRAAAELCADLEPNQACYGDASAERVSLGGLARLTTSAADVAPEEWGVAVIEATLNDQPVTFLLMGDAVMESAVTPEAAEEAAPEVVPVPATVNTNGQRANLRAGPSTVSAVITALDDGTALDLIATTAPRDWYQARLEDDRTAWVYADLVEVSDAEAAAALPVFGEEPPAAAADSGPGMARAFTFNAALEATPCNEAVNALVVQGGDDEAATFGIGDMAVSLNATAVFVRAEGVLPPDDTAVDLLVVLLVEGQLETTVGDLELTLTEPGTAFGVTLDAEGRVGPEAQVLAPSSDAAATLLQSACRNAAEVQILPEAVDPTDCRAEIAYLHTITATNDLDWPVVLWIDAVESVPFEAGETKTFLVVGGERVFQACNEGAQPGDSECGAPESRLIDENKTWLGWRPEP